VPPIRIPSNYSIESINEITLIGAVLVRNQEVRGKDTNLRIVTRIARSADR
jgi:hypothetical protein